MIYMSVYTCVLNYIYILNLEVSFVFFFWPFNFHRHASISKFILSLKQVNAPLNCCPDSFY